MCSFSSVENGYYFCGEDVWIDQGKILGVLVLVASSKPPRLQNAKEFFVAILNLNEWVFSLPEQAEVPQQGVSTAIL